MKKQKLNYCRINRLLYGLIIFLLSMAGSEYVNAQTSYRYLKFNFDQGPPTHMTHIKWKMGDKDLPISGFKGQEYRGSMGSVYPIGHAFSENIETTLKTQMNIVQPGYGAFNKGEFAAYIGIGSEMILEFKNEPVYVTGIELNVRWTGPEIFSCYGSNDGEEWEHLYTSPLLDSWHAYTKPGSSERGYTADFGLPLPSDIDMQPPPTPTGLSVNATTSVSADISWNSVSDSGVGLLYYEIFLDGKLWSVSNINSATVYGLSKETNYTVQVRAVDFYANRSQLSAAQPIGTTGDYPLAIRRIDVGSGIGHELTGTGVFKDSPNFAANWQSSNPSEGPFTQAFIDDMKELKVIRFMDVFGINFNKIENWNDRIQADAPDQIQKYNGTYEIHNHDVLSYEWAIYLCNITNTDMWLNVPADANEHYIRELAKLVKNNLNSNLKIYLENSNETWGGFPAYAAYLTKGEALGFGTGQKASNYYMVYKTLKVFKWFDEEFGSEKHRIYDVLAGQAANTGVALNHLSALKDGTVYPNDVVINPDNKMPDFYALAPYFGSNGDVVNDDDFTLLKGGVDEVLAFVADHYSIWNPEGVPLVMYEGGLSEGEGAFRYYFNHSPAVYNAYLYYLDELSPLVSNFMQYSYTFGNNNSPGFGAVDYVGQPIEESHKFRAMVDWIDVNKNNPGGDNIPPVIFKDITDLTVPNGVKEVSFSVAALGTDSYKWFRDNTEIAGATTSKYTLANQLSMDDNGSTFHVVASNVNGASTSGVGTLTIAAHDLDIDNVTTAPIIDGNIDGMWAGIVPQSIGNVNKGSVSSNADLSASYKVVWDLNNIYFLIEVTDDILVEDATGIDPETYNYDGVEFYINGDNAYVDSYDDDDAQFMYSWHGDIKAFAGGKSTDNMQVAQIDVTNGYIMEVSMPWSIFGVSPENATFIGLDLMVSDNDIIGSNKALNKMSWHTLVNDSWKNPKEFGSVQLTGDDLNKKLLTVITQYGQVVKSPDKPLYDFNESVFLTATADEDYIFTGWSGGATGTTNPLSITMDSHKNITANFALTIPLKTSSPTIDGTAESFWSDVPSIDVQKTIQGSAVSASDLSASFKTAWTNSHLYFFVTVTDDNIQNDSPDNWNDDTIEIYLDINNDKFTSYGSDDFQMIFPQGGDIQVLGNSIDVSGFQRSQIATSTGYVLELAIPWSAFGAAAFANGTEIGMDVHVNDDDDGGDRDTKLAWHTTLDDSWKDPSLFGTGVLSDGNSTPGGTAYRYLKVTFNDYGNFKLRELEWDTDNGAIPASAMTSNSSAGVVVSNSQGWPTYNVFDDVYNDTGYWIGAGTTPRSVTVDMGSNPAVPSAIKIYTASWSDVNGFKAEGSNDNTNWDLLISKTAANGEFVPSNLHASAKVGVFSFETSVPVSKTLNVTAVNGTVAKSPDKSSYTPNESVTLTATAANGYDFTGWSGAASGSTNPLTITMDSDKNITANFTQVASGTTYRYLKVTFTDMSGLHIMQLAWMTDNGTLPSSGMTSNNSAGVAASNSANWNIAYRAFDHNYEYGVGNLWVGNTGEVQNAITLDLINNPSMPTAITIYETSWSTINAFKIEASNDNVNWDLLLNKTNANGEFVLSSAGSNLKEATFSLNGSSGGGGTAVSALTKSTNDAFDNIKVYPNPVEGSLNVALPNELKGNVSMSLMDITGALIWKKELKSSDNNHRTIDISKLTKGFYILEFRNDVTLRQYKIVKE